MLRLQSESFYRQMAQILDDPARSSRSMDKHFSYQLPHSTAPDSWSYGFYSNWVPYTYLTTLSSERLLAAGELKIPFCMVPIGVTCPQIRTKSYEIASPSHARE